MSIHSATNAQYSVCIHVPTIDNLGGTFGVDTFNAIEDYLLRVFGAFDVAVSNGVWKSDTGRVYRDPKHKYTVDVNTAQDCHVLREYAETLRDTLNQECVYVTVSPITTYLV